MADAQRSPNAESPPNTATGEYVVVARRYRPRQFGELVGQEHIAQALGGAISGRRVGHAYLFTGARGVGKTSAARILAKALNCTTGPTPEPCDACDSCLGVAAGSDIDVLEIDGASNRGIDEMRELRQNVGVRPSRSRFKIYIIDEVHMLTDQAFNALLKTLEEPPEHVKFIFCTTEPEKIPVTVLSRCQRFDFAGVQTPSICRRLAQIVEAEGVVAEPAALEVLARRAAGSMRDSQSLLEQLLAFGGNQLTLAEVERMLGTAGDGRLGEICRALIERRTPDALAHLDQAIVEGVDIGPLLDQMLGYFRDCLFAAVGAPPETFRYTSPNETVAIAAIGRQLGAETLLAIMAILEQTSGRLRASVHGRMLLELAIVRICKLEDLENLSSIIARFRDGAAALASPSAPPRLAQTASRPAASLALEAEAQKKNGPVTSVAPQIAAPTQPSNGAAPTPAFAGPDAGASGRKSVEITPENALAIWKQVVESLADMSLETAGLAERAAIPAPNRLVVSFVARYTSVKMNCERPEHLIRFEQSLSRLTGRSMQVQFEICDSPAVAAKSRGFENGTTAVRRESLAEASRRPLVRKAMEVFDARPIRLE